MTDENMELESKRFPWMRSRIDLAGMLGAVAAFLVMVLLSLLWGPLFLIGLAGLVLVVLATRSAERTPPADAAAVVSPVDGVLTSISDGVPPAELRLSAAPHVRLRLASSPATPNSVFAPMAGEILSLIEETGDPSVRFAREPDEAGLASAYVTIASGDDKVGVRVSTGGLGPRLDITSEVGDPVRTGRQIGVRRLGGWCDVWLPADLRLAVWPGMTVKGGETRLVFEDQATAWAADESAEGSEAVPFEMPTLDEDDEAEASEAAVEEVAETEEANSEDDAPEPEPDENSPSEGDGVVKDASEQFARLRKKVEASKKTDADD